MNTLTNVLTNVFVFYFKGADIKTLAADNPDYVLVTCALETRKIDRKAVAVVKVCAESFVVPPKGSTGKKPNTDGSIHNVAGCPVPPCIPGGGAGDDECQQEAEQLIEYIQNNLL
jgi:hypothetical protein